ncbi:hypothetical protein FACS1894166_07650 [Bacilli bacterium]|nr:hypothetical protein FACS1894166_07650 [Bacilli bacterium]
MHYVRREYHYANNKKHKLRPANSIDDDTLKKFKLARKFNVTIYRKQKYLLDEYRNDVQEIQAIF